MTSFLFLQLGAKVSAQLVFVKQIFVSEHTPWPALLFFVIWLWTVQIIFIFIRGF